MYSRRTNPITSKIDGTLTCGVFPRPRGRYEVVCSLVKPTGEVTVASHGTFPGKEAAVERAREVAIWMKKNPIRHIDGWQWGTTGKIYSRKEQAMTQMRAIHWVKGKRNPISEQAKFLKGLVTESDMRLLRPALGTEEISEVLRDITRRRGLRNTLLIHSALIELTHYKLPTRTAYGERNPLTAREKAEIKNWANVQYGIAQRYQDDPIRSAFWKGRAVGMGKVAKVYNPNIIEKMGNILSELNILAIPLIVWLILEIQGKMEE